MKKRKISKLCKTIIATSLFLCMVLPVAATDNTNANADKDMSVVITTTKEERDKQFKEIMEKIIASYDTQENARGSKYKYKTEYLSYMYETVGGYAGNQVSGGYKFSTGGGFYFSDSGGPDVTGSINLSLPAPFNSVSFSINLGKKASSGMFVTVPDTTNHYKLWVNKTMELRPYVTYRARVGTEDWEIWTSSAVPIVYSVNPYARKVQ